LSPELRNVFERFVKFAGVGAIGTAGHYATLLILVNLVRLDAVVSSSAGFVVGGIINYALNYKFTFRSQQSHASTAPKFFAIALGGFFLNGLAMTFFVNKLGIHYLLAQVVTTGLILIWTFLANHYWTFSHSTRPSEEGRHQAQQAFLIVNADDFGYFRCVSQGIAHAHAAGVLTATAILANSSRFEEDVELAKSLPDLDFGVHLNLTTGSPLSPPLKEKLGHNNGCFTSKGGLVKSVLARSITARDIETEWTMQIERCRDAGLPVRFLNSHEHMHMLPTLFPVVQRLAERFDIRHVRVPAPDPIQLFQPLTLIRDIPLALLSRRAMARMSGRPASFLGMSVSGRLSLSYLEKGIPKLEKGNICELMCHPGHFDPEEITDPGLLAYHDWQSELDVLTSPAFKSLLDKHNIQLVRYRDIDDDFAAATRTQRPA